jgi:hypothetical protein
MPLRGIVAGLGLAFVALGWWRVLQQRARATGTVTRRPRREHDHTGTQSTEVTFEIEGREFRFSPSVVTNFDAGTLAIGAKVAVAYDPNDPTSADLAEPWRQYSGPVLVTLTYVAALYYLFIV